MGSTTNIATEQVTYEDLPKVGNIAHHQKHARWKELCLVSGVCIYTYVHLWILCLYVKNALDWWIRDTSCPECIHTWSTWVQLWIRIRKHFGERDWHLKFHTFKLNCDQIGSILLWHADDMLGVARPRSSRQSSPPWLASLITQQEVFKDTS